MTDYLLFNNILKEKLQKELRDVEVIPIFGKFHYIFFYELANWLNLDYWFLLDGDGHLNNSKKNNPNHLFFWEKYGKGKTEEQNGGIIHGKNEEKISWICSNIEDFLGIKVDSKDKEYNLISKSEEIIKNLEKNNLVKLNEIKKIFSFINKVRQ